MHRVGVETVRSRVYRPQDTCVRLYCAGLNRRRPRLGGRRIGRSRRRRCITHGDDRALQRCKVQGARGKGPRPCSEEWGYARTEDRDGSTAVLKLVELYVTCQYLCRHGLTWFDMVCDCRLWDWCGRLLKTFLRMWYERTAFRVSQLPLLTCRKQAARVAHAAAARAQVRPSAERSRAPSRTSAPRSAQKMRFRSSSLG